VVKISDHCRKTHKKLSFERYQSTYLTGRILTEDEIKDVVASRLNQLPSSDFDTTAKKSISGEMVQESPATGIHKKQYSCQSDQSKKINGQKSSSLSGNNGKDGKVLLKSSEVRNSSKVRDSSEVRHSSKVRNPRKVRNSSKVKDSSKVRDTSDVSQPQVAEVPVTDGLAEETDGGEHEVVAVPEATAGLEKKRRKTLDSLCMCRCKVCHQQMYHHELKEHWKR
jgi:exonuclease V gamma subunit